MSDTRTQPNYLGMALKHTHGMSINKPGDQELPSRQSQPLELSTMTDLLQECIHLSRCSPSVRRRDLPDGLNETVFSDIEKRIGDGFVRTLINGGENGASDKERHLTLRERER